MMMMMMKAVTLSDTLPLHYSPIRYSIVHNTHGDWTYSVKNFLLRSVLRSVLVILIRLSLFSTLMIDILQSVLLHALVSRAA